MSETIFETFWKSIFAESLSILSVTMRSRSNWSSIKFALFFCNSNNDYIYMKSKCHIYKYCSKAACQFKNCSPIQFPLVTIKRRSVAGSNPGQVVSCDSNTNFKCSKSLSYRLNNQNKLLRRIGHYVINEKNIEASFEQV